MDNFKTNFNKNYIFVTAVLCILTVSTLRSKSDKSNKVSVQATETLVKAHKVNKTREISSVSMDSDLIKKPVTQLSEKQTENKILDNTDEVLVDQRDHFHDDECLKSMEYGETSVIANDISDDELQDYVAEIKASLQKEQELFVYDENNQPISKEEIQAEFLYEMQNMGFVSE